MFSFLQRGVPAMGRVLYPGSIPPPLDTIESSLAPTACRRVAGAAEQLWTIEAQHPTWGTAEIACERQPAPLPDEIIDYTVGLSDEEKQRARRGESTIAVRVRAQHQHALRDRKRLLFWLRALMQADGVVAVDAASTLLWSKAMLDDELAHDADVDVESLYALHAVQDEADRTRVTWLHTHGLEELGAFDVDVLEPSPLFVNNCADTFRALAFGALEGTVAPDTPRFQLAYPGGEVRLVPVDRFDAQAAPEHRKLRSPEHHSGRRAVVCDPAGGLLGRFRSTPVPSRFLSSIVDDGIVIPFSTAATALMAERAKKTMGVFERLRQEFASLELPVLVKLGYDVVGGDPGDREHLWFAVHGVSGDTVDATLANTPHRVPSLKAGVRGEHDLTRLSDWTIMSPEGMMTPRNISAARKLRANLATWQERFAQAKTES